jgi:cell division protein FtsL
MATNENRKSKLSRFEKKLVKICLILLLLFPVVDVFSKATLSKANLEVERLKKVLSVQQRKNQSLTMKVDELKSFDNIRTVIESQGLAYNSNNIKVINKN